MTYTLHLPRKTAPVKPPDDASLGTHRAAPAPVDAPLPHPHARDESITPDNGEPHPTLAQASHDIDAGMVDTDMRATPGLDAQTRDRFVPGPGGNPPRRRR